MTQTDPAQGREPGTPAAAPCATYRLQLGPAFGLPDAAGIAGYLARLGVSDAYLSPVFAARPGSEHGYDICDHSKLNPEIGGEEGFTLLEDALSAQGLGAILDIVPNHMGIDPTTNRWWRDVLENGPSSPFASFFDIDWDPVKEELENRVLLPILGDQYGAVLERSELRLHLADGALELRYFDHRLPLNPRQTPLVYNHDLDGLRAALGETDPHVREFLSILTSLHNLPPYVTRDVDQVAERQREKEIARERLAQLVEASPAIRSHIERALEHFNGVPGAPSSFAPLHDVLERQAFRLAYWRTAFDEINYRRFFDVNELAGLRTEHPTVFAHTHALVLRLMQRGVVRGLRVDHPDGLFDPRQYFERLRTMTARGTLDDPGQPPVPTGPAGPPASRQPIYLVAEKILTHGESLPADWPIDGTTGYSFLNEVNGLFVDRDGLAALRRIHTRFTGERASFADLVYECKKFIMLTSLASELNVLAHTLNRLSEASWRTRDFTLNSCRRALLEVIACLPVYRTYVTASSTGAHDREAIELAIGRARRRNPVTEPTIYEFVERLMLPHDRREGADVEGPSRDARLDFACKLQQYTGPVHAKGVEDTAFYRYNVLTSLNEVGGDPGRDVTDPLGFHEQNRRRLAERPREMIATATHDTKRGEDVRARLHVLSEMPDAWRRAVGQWTRINAGHREMIDGLPAPSRSDEYLFYQTLVGMWPLEADAPGDRAPEAVVERLAAYMLKAGREAKVRSSWANVNEPYERAVSTFVQRVLTGPSAPRFLAAFLPLQRLVADGGMVNALAQLALKIASPGVPDFYQGTELWDLSLVDPDNRRPVDFAHRQRLLDELAPLLPRSCRDASAAPDPEQQAAMSAELVQHWRDGRLKLYLTACGLNLRRTCPELFLEGDYLPLSADAAGREHLVAFARRRGADVLIVVVPRLTRRLPSIEGRVPVGVETWGTTRIGLTETLGDYVYRDLMTGDRLRPDDADGARALVAADVLRICPVALLWGTPAAR